MMSLQDFEMYHAKNPQVYEYFEKFTFQVIRSGRKYFSARAIYERIRWQTQVEDSMIDFKLMDHPMPFYARLFEKNHPKYLGFFRKRKCEADKILENS